MRGRVGPKRDELYLDWFEVPKSVYASRRIVVGIKLFGMLLTGLDLMATQMCALLINKSTAFR